MVQGSMSCVKYLMFVFNFVFVVCGIILIAIGGVVYNKNFTVFLDNKFVTAPTILIVIGVIIFLIAFLGCCGAVKENSCMVTTFGALLFLIFVIEVAGAAVAYAYKDKFEDFLKTNMNKTIHEEQDKYVKNVWDDIQKNLKCCGVVGPQDYPGVIPLSCCADTSTEICVKGNAYQNGCYDKLIDEIKDNITMVGGAAIGIAVIELIGVMFAWCLASAIKKEYEGV